MTRFMISLEQGVGMVWDAFQDMVGGEIYVKKIPSMKITDLAAVVAPNAKQEIIGIRPGEKLHEQMIGVEDAASTYFYGNHYKILPSIHGWDLDPLRIKHGIKVADDFVYSSDSNSDWMSREQLMVWLEDNRQTVGRV